MPTLKSVDWVILISLAVLAAAQLTGSALLWLTGLALIAFSLYLTVKSDGS